MLFSGDVHGGLRRLETLLRAVKYPGDVDYGSLSRGDPSAFLPIVSYALTSFSPLFTEQLMAAGLELTGKTDLRFTDAMYKMLRDVFHYKPVLTKQQFLQWGFSQKKVSIVCDVINFVLQKHNQLKKLRVRRPALNRSEVGAEVQTSAPDHPTVINHPDLFSVRTQSSPESRSSGPSEEEEGEQEEEQEEDLRQSVYHHDMESSEVKGRLLALEDQVRTLQAGLDRIRMLEERLEELERRRDGEKVQDMFQRDGDVVQRAEDVVQRDGDVVQRAGDVVLVSRETWDNLLSRVLLLETKAELSGAQMRPHPPPPCPGSSSSKMSEASKEDLKERLERITIMMKSILLKGAEPPATPTKTLIINN